MNIVALFSPARRNAAPGLRSFFSHAVLLLGLAGGLLAAAVSPAAAQAGTWTHVTTNPYDGYITTMLLTDGTLMAMGSGDWHNWWKLTPDAQGNYADGTWSARTPSHVGRLYFPSAVLKDGRVITCGGEYLTNSTDNYNEMEIYDPLTDTWTQGPNGLYGDIGDTGSQVLADGRFLCSTRSGPQTQIYDTATGVWTAAATKITNTSGDEESWQILPDGSIFDALDNPGERYLPTQDQWISVAQCPVPMTATGEIGPFVLMYNGKCFCISETGQTAIYTPPSALNGAGSWQTGPTFPGGQAAGDVPGCIETNGKVLCVASPGLYGTAYFYEYDPTANTLTAIAGPAGQTFSRSDVLRLLALPNGQILLSTYSSDGWVYTPAGAPNDAWRPTVSAVTANSDGSFHLTGTQLNGLSSGGSYGDDADMSTNYPIVELVDSQGNVYYCRTYNFSTMGLATGSAPVSTEFTVPANLLNGTYTLYAVANGISSAPYTFTYPLPPASHTQLLWANANGQASLWNVSEPNGTVSHTEFGPYSGWSARAVTADPDGSDHLLWTNTNGEASVWNVSASGSIVDHEYGPFPGYSAASLSTGGDGASHLVWNRTDGQASLWTLNTTNGSFTHAEYGPFSGWTAQAVASGPSATDLLWANADGTISGWAMNGSGYSHTEYGPFGGWAAFALAVGPDNTAYPLLHQTDGEASVWSADFTSGAIADTEYGPFSGMTAKGIATGPDNVTHLLWDNTDGTASLWNLINDAYAPGYTSTQYGPFPSWTAVAVSAGP